MKKLSFLYLLAIISIALCISFTSGCAVKAPGSRTVTFGPDEATVTSETIATQSSDQVEIEKEKTRQVCYKNKEKEDKAIREQAKDAPMALVMLKQTEALNNALSLIKTGKNYDPCPSSANSSDVEIADAQMYSNIYTGAIGLGKFIAGAWMATEISGDLFGSLAKAGGYSLLASGEGSSIQVTDAFKSSIFRDGATVDGGILSDLSTKTIKVIEPVPDPELEGME